MNYEKLLTDNFKIVAGFDSSINRLETIITEIPVYPTHQIEEIIKGQNIELAVLTVPGEAAENTVEKLVLAGIRGIVNFSPVILNENRKDVYITNIDVLGEFRYLSAMFTLNSDNNKK